MCLRKCILIKYLRGPYRFYAGQVAKIGGDWGFFSNNLPR